MEDNRPPYPRDIPVEQTYPDPNAELAPTTPFYNQSHQHNIESTANDKAIEDAAAFVLQQQQQAGATAESPQANGNHPYPLLNPSVNEIDAGLRGDDGMQHGSPKRMDGNVPLTDEQQQIYAQNGQDSAQRKRTKVSRACDECRRKKIRCDVTDTEGVPCSSCKRTGMMCAFSRQPMKRGPSKGYIKELAERLNSLESQLNTPQGQPQQQQQQGLPSSTPDFQMQMYSDLEPQMRDGSPSHSQSRKRTHSMSEQANINIMPRENSYAQARPPNNAWSPETSRQLPPLAAMVPGGGPPFAQPNTDTFPPRPPQMTPHGHDWRFDVVQEHRPENQLNAMEKEISQPEPPTSFDYDESVMDEYVHGIFTNLEPAKPLKQILSHMSQHIPSLATFESTTQSTTTAMSANITRSLSSVARRFREIFAIDTITTKSGCAKEHEASSRIDC